MEDQPSHGLALTRPAPAIVKAASTTIADTNADRAAIPHDRGLAHNGQRLIRANAVPAGAAATRADTLCLLSSSYRRRRHALSAALIRSRLGGLSPSSTPRPTW